MYGRRMVAQELLLILEEYWERHPEIAHVPIYQASALATRALSIFQTYIEMMNEDIKAAFQVARHPGPRPPHPDLTLISVLPRWIA